MMFLAFLMFVLFPASSIRRLIASLMDGITLALINLGSSQLPKQVEVFLLSDSNNRYLGLRGLKCLPVVKRFNLSDTDSQYLPMS